MNRTLKAGLVVALTLAAVLAAAPAPAAAQDVEIGAILGFNFSGLGSTYSYSFVPPFPNKPYTGNGSLAVLLRRQSSGLGYGGYFNIAMREHWLLQLSYHGYSTAIISDTTTYSLALNYTASHPAGTPPQALSYASTVDWPNTQGTMKNSALSASLVYRIGSIEGVALDLMGGLSYFHFSGSFQALAVTRFGLDADGNLTSEEFGLAVDFGPKNAFGLNAGAAFNVHFNSNFGLLAEARYYYCPDVPTTNGFTVLTVGTQLPISLSSVNIRKDAFKVSASFLSLQGGVKVMF